MMSSGITWRFRCRPTIILARRWRTRCALIRTAGPRKGSMAMGKESKARVRRECEHHGLSGTRTYSAWQNMWSRCRGHPKQCQKDYVERGITVCDRWKSFSLFLSDMGECPAGLTLDRIDNDGGYNPENCRWATRKVQQNNTRPLRCTNKSGVKGVCWDTRKHLWLATYHGRF